MIYQLCTLSASGLQATPSSKRTTLWTTSHQTTRQSQTTNATDTTKTSDSKNQSFMIFSLTQMNEWDRSIPNVAKWNSTKPYLLSALRTTAFRMKLLDTRRLISERKVMTKQSPLFRTCTTAHVMQNLTNLRPSTLSTTFSCASYIQARSQRTRTDALNNRSWDRRSTSGIRIRFTKSINAWPSTEESTTG